MTGVLVQEFEKRYSIQKEQEASQPASSKTAEPPQSPLAKDQAPPGTNEQAPPDTPAPGVKREKAEASFDTPTPAPKKKAKQTTGDNPEKAPKPGAKKAVRSQVDIIIANHEKMKMDTMRATMMVTDIVDDKTNKYADFKNLKEMTSCAKLRDELNSFLSSSPFWHEWL